MSHSVNRLIPSIALLLSVLFADTSAAQTQSVASDVKIEPPNWWVGMANSQVELMLEGSQLPHPLNQYNIQLIAQDVSIAHVVHPANPNYAFVTLTINPKAAAQTIELRLTHPNSLAVKLEYTLAERREQSAQREGFSTKDVIYLITPDRFANGDPSNDVVETMQEGVNRAYKGGRHGGDIQGMINALDYISDMGFTQVWTMPLLENAMQRYSYHGYSTTDYFAIDPRFGSNELYKAFSAQAKAKGVGVIKDVILNHIGSAHPWMSNMPSPDWINHGTEFTPTTHTREALHDPHGVQGDIDEFATGWFVDTMPDLNQQNPHLAQYLIQHAIWWIEYADLSGLRVDTYSYSDKTFLSHWTQAVMAEYPNLNIVGEEWSVNPSITAYWQRGSQRHDDYQSALPSVMDFPLQVALSQALLQEDTWATGLRKIYTVLAADFVYGDPYNLVVFGDNHDMNRIMPQLNNDPALLLMAQQFLLTTRGIPQIFYGTEIGMTDSGKGDHGLLRADFPGGWAGDSVNGFTGVGLSLMQRDIQQQLRWWLNWRKQTPAVTHGKLTQYYPKAGIYVYFRTTETQTIMVVLNKNTQESELDLSRFKQMLPTLDHSDAPSATTTLVDVYTQNHHVITDDPLYLKPKSVTVYEVQ